MSGSAFFSSVRTRLMLLVLLAVLPAVGLTLYLSHQSGKFAARHTLEDAMRLVQLASTDYGRLVESTHHLLGALARLPAVRERHTGACSALLTDLKTGYPHYANLGAIRSDGRVFCSAMPMKQAVNASDRDYFRRAVATHDFAASDYQIGRITGKPVVVFAHPAHDPAGRLQAVVFAAFDLTWLNRMAANAQLPAGTTLTILDSHGTVLNRWPDPEKWIGKSMGDLPLTRTILTSQEAGTIEAAGLDGVSRLYAFAPLFATSPDRRAYISVGIPREIAFAEINLILIRTLGGLAFVAALVLLAAWYGGDYFLLKKIYVLADTARHLARGERARTGIADTRGEIGLLARTFDDMANAIEARTDEILRANEALAESEAKLRTVSESVRDAILMIDDHGRITFWNRAAETMFGYRREEALGQDIAGLIVPAKLREAHNKGLEAFQRAGEGPAIGKLLELPARRRDGSEFIAEHSISAVQFEGKWHAVGIVRDITERIQSREKLLHLTHHDGLTGLPNRVLLLDRLAQSLIDAKRHNRVVAVLWLDMDNFKNVNDSLGIENGDRIIRAMGERLQNCVRPGDTVARAGGDEFCIVLADLAHEGDVAEIIQKIRDSLSAPHRMADQELHLSVTIGVSLFPRNATEPEVLLKNADTAMYHAKERGDGYQYYSPDMTVIATERLAIENDLRHALERRELFLHYQPQVNIHTGTITGVEALLRWRHPRLGLVSPAKFIPLAEDTNLILPIGEWVLREACAQAHAWQDAGLPPLRMGVNLSARQFRQPDLAGTVRRILDETGFDPKRLDIELTESTLVQNPEAAAEILTGLETLGVQISIDDFGTGYSSLSYLKRLPIDILKIDQSFVRDIATDPDDAAIVIAIITLARALGIQTIAEGVETREQAQFLRKHGCEAMQGFYFSKPIEADALAALLRKQARQSERERVMEWFER